MGICSIKGNGLIAKAIEQHTKELDRDRSYVMTGKSLKISFSQLASNCAFSIFWVAALRFLGLGYQRVQLKQMEGWLWTVRTAFKVKYTQNQAAPISGHFLP